MILQIHAHKRTHAHAHTHQYRSIIVFRLERSNRLQVAGFCQGKYMSEHKLCPWTGFLLRKQGYTERGWALPPPPQI